MPTREENAAKRAATKKKTEDVATERAAERVATKKKNDAATAERAAERVATKKKNDAARAAERTAAKEKDTRDFNEYKARKFKELRQNVLNVDNSPSDDDAWKESKKALLIADYKAELVLFENEQMLSRVNQIWHRHKLSTPPPSSIAPLASSIASSASSIASSASDTDYGDGTWKSVESVGSRGGKRKTRRTTRKKNTRKGKGNTIKRKRKNKRKV
jgi:hypothetical protein